MDDETPQPGTVRYFTDGGSYQVAYNLRDPGPFLAAGLDEVDEDTYRAATAALDDAAASGLDDEAEAARHERY
jgi:hypothetical protein